MENTGKRKRIYTKHKITTSENDNILLPEKEINNKRRYSDNDSLYLPPKYSSKNSTFQSPQKTHPTNVNDINSQDYDPIISNVIAVQESPASSDNLLMIFEPKKMMQIFCHTKSKKLIT